MFIADVKDLAYKVRNVGKPLSVDKITDVIITRLLDLFESL